MTAKEGGSVYSQVKIATSLLRSIRNLSLHRARSTIFIANPLAVARCCTLKTVEVAPLPSSCSPGVGEPSSAGQPLYACAGVTHTTFPGLVWLALTGFPRADQLLAGGSREKMCVGSWSGCRSSDAFARRPTPCVQHDCPIAMHM